MFAKHIQQLYPACTTVQTKRNE
uniref:Uncharacterized protein n=1 Tax=Arundo donax TaxID=35708 RepID=A0A0A9H9V8_ARUDO